MTAEAPSALPRDPGPRRRLAEILYAKLPRYLSLTLGALLRLGGRGDSRFLDRLDHTHTQAMLALSDAHWERLLRTLDLVGFRSVLDVGCGSGAWLLAMARLNAHVVGVDPDRGVLEVARAHCGGVGNVDIRQMGAESLKFDDDTFDAVMCFSVLPYVDQDAAISEIQRVLKPSGTLMIGTVGAGYYTKHVVEGIRHDRLDAIRYGLDPILVAAGRALRGNNLAPASLRSWSPRSVRRLLERHGFDANRGIRDVDAADPGWPKSFLGRPMYFVMVATQRAPGRSRSEAGT